MKKLILLSMSFLFFSFCYGADGREIAKKNGINASSKASAQWQRKFDKGRKPFKSLSKEEQVVLLEYLKKHAADSNTPEAAGL